jgi:hypothetical protein
MQYMLTGFTHHLRCRVFAFEGVGADRVRTDYSVSADLSLIRKYGIRMQELPLLCRGILDKLDGSDMQRAFTYTESDMGLRATSCAAQVAAQKKKPWRKPQTAVV